MHMTLIMPLFLIIRNTIIYDKSTLILFVSKVTGIELELSEIEQVDTLP